jgi:hypothetical protein
VDLSINDGFYGNAAMRPVFGHSTVDRYEVITNVYTPPILAGACHMFSTPLIRQEELKDKFSQFSKALKKANKESNGNYAQFIPKFFESIKLGTSNAQGSTTYYDLSCLFVTSHEIAHAYVEQVTKRFLSNSEMRSFEYIVDLMAADILYQKIVKFTPNDDTYRHLAGHKTHKESIVKNTQIGITTITLVLIFLGLAGSFNNGGLAKLEGGPKHPHTLFRNILQYVHFSTLVMSNFSSFFDKEDTAIVDSLWTKQLSLLVNAGFVNHSDLETLKASTAFEDFKGIPAVIKEYNIEPLKKFVPVVEEVSKGINRLS